MTYSDKLKDPRWQKKRLEMFDQFEWQCCNCKSKVNELHLHHKFYLPNRDPWDYEDHYFSVLCSSCHIKEHKKKNPLYELIDSVLFNQLSDFDIYSELLSSVVEIAMNKFIKEEKEEAEANRMVKIEKNKNRPTTGLLSIDLTKVKRPSLKGITFPLTHGREHYMTRLSDGCPIPQNKDKNK